MKHTPSPWFIQDRLNGYAVYVPCAHNIGQMRGIAPRDVARDMSAEYARLIAAAPDLLAALEDAEFLLRKAGAYPGPMQGSFRRSAEDARAAIAKATK